MNIKIFDFNGVELKVGDLVKVKTKSNYDFYTTIQVINGQLYPFNKFAYDIVLKADSLPVDFLHIEKTDKMPEYWISKTLKEKLEKENRIDKWRLDCVVFNNNSFYFITE